MNEVYVAKVKGAAVEAKKQWEKFAEAYDDLSDFKKKFHLRPTSSGVTIVSTLDEKPMKGIRVGKTTVKEKLDEIYHLMNSNKTKEEKLMELEKLGFKNENNKMEEKGYQVQMIAGMAENQSLKEYLKVDRLTFIASEFILNDGTDKSEGERIDIIGYDGEHRLFFFELKDAEDPKGDPVDQVKKYVKTYGEVKRDAMLRILAEYPVNSVPSKEIIIEGYAVYGYGNKVDVNKSKEVVYEDTVVGVIKFQGSRLG